VQNLCNTRVTDRLGRGARLIEQDRFTTAEDVMQLAHYVAGHDAPIGLTIPNESLVDVRCLECGHQVEAVTDEQGWAMRP
jgi:hypothetical protein